MPRTTAANWKTDLTAYRSRVAATVTRIQNDGYLTEEQANALLVRLGLPPESKFKATFNVQAKQTITRRLASGTADGAALEAEQIKARIADYATGYGWEIDPDSVEFTVVDQASEIKETAEPGHDTTDYETYKKLVRRVGVREAVAHDWCDSGVNRYFEYLGLKITVPVAVTTTVVQRIRVDEAEDAEEAARLVSEGRVDEVVQRQMGRQVKVESYAAIDVDAAAVGDPDPTNAYVDDRCTARLKYRSFYCTREQGHGGANHVAGNGVTVVGVWPVA